MNFPESRRADHDLPGEAGYTLVALLIVVAIVNIGLSVAVTSWLSIDTRAREVELIWRGQAIALAIVCHGATEAAEPLERLEQLVESNCLRRLYPDPMSTDGKWRILRRSDLIDGTIAALQGQPVPEADDTGGVMGVPGTPEPTETSATPGTSGSRLQMVTVDRPSLQDGLSSGLSTVGAGGLNTIIGVMSNKTGAATRLYRTQERYERWLFLGVQDGP